MMEKIIMNTRKIVLLTVLVFALVLAACVPVATPAGGGAAAASQPCNQITVGEKEGRPDLQGCTLRIAVENAYQPFNYIDPDTKKGVGYDYDVFGEICTRINCKPEFVETSWDAMVAIMGGQGATETFDVGADGITITEERAQHVDFSIPYITSQQMLLVRADESRFTDPDEFVEQADLKIGTQIGTTNYDAAAELLGEDRIVAFDQFGPAVQALIAGDVDAVMIDNVSGLGYVGANPDKVKLIEQSIKSEELGFMFGKGSPLKAPIDTALQAMQADGKMDELYQKWFAKE
jgi:ABC-type amino acid transport substrate-binding protein